MEYSVVNLGIQDEPNFHEHIVDTEAETLIEMVQRYRETQPVLVYTTEQGLEELVKVEDDAIVLDEMKDCAVLEDAEKRNEEGMHKVFVTARETSMRGLDFRAPTIGMVLIVNAAFSSPRDKSQGMGRVGRFKDKCTRVKFGTFEDVDDEKSREVWTKLMKLVNKGRKQTDFYAMDEKLAKQAKLREQKQKVKEEKAMKKA